jgi:hypothetical protein
MTSCCSRHPASADGNGWTAGFFRVGVLDPSCSSVDAADAISGKRQQEVEGVGRLCMGAHSARQRLGDCVTRRWQYCEDTWPALYELEPYSFLLVCVGQAPEWAR